MRAHRGAFDAQRPGWQAHEPHLAAAAGPDGADDRAVGKDAAHARSSVEAGIGEKFADHERSGLLGAKLLGPRGDRTQYACAGDNSDAH